MNLISTHAIKLTSRFKLGFKPSLKSRVKSFYLFRLIVLAFLAMPVSMVQAEINSATLSDEQKQSLIHLVKQDCGSCHGMRLKGGLGPELTQEKMSVIGVANLMAVIKYGRLGTAMPPWQAILNDTEIQYIAEQLVAGVK